MTPPVFLSLLRAAPQWVDRTVDCGGGQQILYYVSGGLRSGLRAQEVHLHDPEERCTTGDERVRVSDRDSHEVDKTPL